MGKIQLSHALGIGAGGSLAAAAASSSGRRRRSSSTTRPPSRWDEYWAYVGYKSGCGRGDVDGDGVTPLEIAFLPGARSEVLPGVWHTPRRRPQIWYGDPEAIDAWSKYLWWKVFCSL